jgi:hypothetical protein
VSARARCPCCSAVVRVTAAGRLVEHRYSIVVSRGMVRQVGRGRVRRPCPGGGREVER